jgi:hypothetical protein
VLGFTLLNLPSDFASAQSPARDSTSIAAARAPAVAADAAPLPLVPPDPLWPRPFASWERVTMDGSVPNAETHIRATPFIIGSTLTAGSLTAMHLYQLNAWWKNNRAPFHFEEDWPYELQVDKFGHFTGGYIWSYLFKETMLWSGFGENASTDVGAAMGLGWQTFIEVEDGFAKSWGFSPTDFYADVAGAAYFWAQNYVPVLQNFQPKWTYWPSSELGNGSMPGQKRTFNDDYQGQTYWWSVNVANLLPQSAQGVWPNWLNLAFGYGARDTNADDIMDYRIYYIGLDYNLSKIIPKSGIPFIDWCVQTANIIHLPAPALQVSPHTKFYLLYPIRLKIGGTDL